MAPSKKSRTVGVTGLATAASAAALYSTSSFLGQETQVPPAAFVSSNVPAAAATSTNSVRTLSEPHQKAAALRGSAMTASTGATAIAAEAPAPQASFGGLSTFFAATLAGTAAAVVAGSRRRRNNTAKAAAAKERFVGGSNASRFMKCERQVALKQAKSDATATQLIPEGIYCEASNRAVRRPTRSVKVGGAWIGSKHPIAIQTMSTTLTHDVEATVAQIKKCADMGIDLVRITVQGMREAKACEHIKRRLLEDGYTTGIVADIHFTPKVALACAEFVDKVRINPGNFADGRKSFDSISELTEEHIKEAQDAIEEALTPLVLRLKAQDKALRIGVNHGSLAERILFQYGDSPEGMVASAIEVGEICRKLDYHNLIFSMKSSNPSVMVKAYRLLAAEMYKLGWDYPLHLGVTEAGGGADGRIKSAVGIGALVLDGLGDTIRVSLTEDPEYEVGPCSALRAASERALGKGVPPFVENNERRQGNFPRRTCDFPLDVPLNMDGSVLATVKSSELAAMDQKALVARFGLRLRQDGDVQREFKSFDAVVIDGLVDANAGKNVEALLNVPLGVACEPSPYVPEGATLLYSVSDVQGGAFQSKIGGYALRVNGEESQEDLEKALQNLKPHFIIFRPDSQPGVTFLARRFFSMLSMTSGAKVPVMLHFKYPADPSQSEDDLVVGASAEFGSLFVDGLGEGIVWEADRFTPDEVRESSFNLLQASRMRITKTEFISCPSCGRTLFNLQDTTKNIQSRTGHLPGVRIAVMGCIVNGPGEMADADFGYVGSGVGKIDLYVKYNCVKRAIPSEHAVDQLIELIKEHGRWSEPPDAEVEEAETEKVLVEV